MRILDAALTEWAASQTPPSGGEPTNTVLVAARDAARRAESVRRLRQVVNELGFQPLPLPDYLAQLARSARINLGRLLLSRPASVAPVAPWVALAKSIGLPNKTIALLVRLWVADRQNNPGSALVMARSTALDGGSPRQIGHDDAAVDANLQAIEDEYDPETKAFLDSCLAEIGP